jgi:hypothetical protein
VSLKNNSKKLPKHRERYKYPCTGNSKVTKFNSNHCSKTFKIKLSQRKRKKFLMEAREKKEHAEVSKFSCKEADFFAKLYRPGESGIYFHSTELKNLSTESTVLGKTFL